MSGTSQPKIADTGSLLATATQATILLPPTSLHTSARGHLTRWPWAHVICTSPSIIFPLGTRPSLTMVLLAPKSRRLSVTNVPSMFPFWLTWWRGLPDSLVALPLNMVPLLGHRAAMCYLATVVAPNSFVPHLGCCSCWGYCCGGDSWVLHSLSAVSRYVALLPTVKHPMVVVLWDLSLGFLLASLLGFTAVYLTCTWLSASWPVSSTVAGFLSSTQTCSSTGMTLRSCSVKTFSVICSMLVHSYINFFISSCSLMASSR